MGREVRMVPADWQHPKDASGAFIPMRASFPYDAAEVAEGWLTGEAPFHGIAVMPQWPASERTHFMMYENTSEGTPISPAFATAEELARWLAETKASAFANFPASYEAWLATIRAGSAPSFLIKDGQLIPGPEAVPS